MIITNENNSNSITTDAELKNYDTVMEFIESKLDEFDCPMTLSVKINVAVDEAIANIMNYAYGDSTGLMTVSVDKAEDRDGVTITFFDKGMPFNPLEKEDPDTEAGIEERKIGGLGIFMIKKIMDKVEYCYDDGNVLKITKYF